MNSTDAIFVSAKDVAELKRQRTVAVAKREALSTEAASLPAKITMAREAVEAAGERDFRGIAAPDELSKARTLLDSLKDRAGELARQEVVANGVMHRIDFEIFAAEAVLKQRRNELGRSVCAAIADELLSDRKLRTKLLEALGVSLYLSSSSCVSAALAWRCTSAAAWTVSGTLLPYRRTSMAWRRANEQR